MTENQCTAGRNGAPLSLVETNDDGCSLNAGATWDRACCAVANGTDPRAVAGVLLHEVTNADARYSLWQAATGCAAEHWQTAATPGTVLRAALALESADCWWTGPGDRPVHVSAFSLLALVQSHRTLRQAVARLVPAADAHATDAEALADEVADDPQATADEMHGRRRHADAVQADVAFALSALAQARSIGS